MALIRVNDNVVAFASNSTGTNRTIFGSTTQSDDITVNYNANIKTGWQIVSPTEVPTKQDFNAQAYTLSYLTAYLYQQGIAEYNANQIYQLNSLCLSPDGTIYRSLTADNSGNALSDTTNWIAYAPQGVNANLVVTVGASGDFTTINEALEFINGNYRKVFKSVFTTIQINLLAGFVMAEQVLVENVDLSYIEIIGADAETTIDHTALIEEFTDANYGVISYPAFGARIGGTLPIINQLFSVNGGLQADNKYGIVVADNSRVGVRPDAGVKNAPTGNLLARDAGIVEARDAIFTGSDRNAIISNASVANLNGANLNNGASYGVIAASSLVNLREATINNCDIGILGGQASQVNAEQSTIDNSTTNAVFSGNGSTVNIVSSNITNQTTGTAINVTTGGVVSANSITTTGTTETLFSQATNTLLSTGIIYN